MVLKDKNKPFKKKTATGKKWKLHNSLNAVNERT